MALSTPEGLEEERRLFYVALTRPRRHLATLCETVSLKGEANYRESGDGETRSPKVTVELGGLWR